jgi:predicted nucleic acid-binding Zn ribbon protein
LARKPTVGAGLGAKRCAVSPWKPLPGDLPEPRPVRDSLAGLAKSLGAPPPALLRAVFERWEEIVGPTIAAHAWPLRVHEGVLRIGVDQPAWATQLTFLGPELLRKVTAATGDSAITGVEIKVVPGRRK